MDLDDRALYLFLGMVLGAVLGYVSRMLQEIHKDVSVLNIDVHDIKEEVDEIDSIVKTRRDRDDGGFMRFPLVADIVLIAVIAMTAWAAVSTGITNNRLGSAIEDIQAVQRADEKQDTRIQKITTCTLEFTSKTIAALNERTTYTGQTTASNVRVLQAQQEFLEIILQVPPPSDEDALVALRTYTDAVAEFNVIAEKQKDKLNRYSYPTNQELATCLGVELAEVEEGDQ